MSDQLDLFTNPSLPVMPEAKAFVAFDSKHLTIQERFLKFHELNPWVYKQLCALARDMVARGRTKLGIGMLWEVLRWNIYRSTVDPSSDLKLNDHYRSRYARLIMDNETDLAEVFEVRELRTV